MVREDVAKCQCPNRTPRNVRLLDCDQCPCCGGDVVPGTGQRREFIFWPTGVANEPLGVYTSWSDLVAALTLEQTPALIEFRSDGSPGSPVVIPAGVWNLTAVSDLLLTGAVDTATTSEVIPILNLSPGATLLVAGTTSVETLSILSLGAGGVIVPTGTHHLLHLVAAANLLASGAGPVLDAGPLEYVLIEGSSAIRGTGSPGGAISVALGRTLIVYTPTGSLEDDTIVGAGSGIFRYGDYYDGGGPGTYGQTQVGLTGGWSSSSVATAILVAYPPAIPGNWPLPTPTNVQEALDSLAASTGITGFFSGVGSPEGVVVANISDIYRRTDGSSGNSIYFKQAGAGNTGWVPAGPTILEEFDAVGSAVFTTTRNFYESASLSIKIFVTWNGVRQREGALNDFTVTGLNQITFNTAPPAGDVVAIEYLPE